MKILAAVVCLFSVGSGAWLRAQEVASPAQVYAEVNGNLATYKSLETLYQLKDDAQPFQVTAWLQEETFRRIKASQTGDGGVLTRDFFYDRDSKLRLALVTLSSEASEGKPATAVEERFDFQNGKLASYVGADKKLVAASDQSFKDMETALLAMSADMVKRIKSSTAYAGMLGGVNEANPAKAPAGTVFGAGYSDGVFSGIEEGDYIHMDLRQADGQMVTFLVISKDPSVVSVVTDPAKFTGKKLRVHWVEKVQQIPEAGGATRMKICERIEIQD